jgi:hypothetical protein
MRHAASKETRVAPNARTEKRRRAPPVGVRAHRRAIESVP